MPRAVLAAPALGTALLLGACAVGPDFKSPAAPAVTSYGATPPVSQTAATPVAGGEAQRFVAGAAVPTRWWRLYGSTKLDALVERAFAANPDVEAAQATLRQAQQTLIATHANLLPFVDANLSAKRQQFSSAAFGGSGTSIFNLYNASVDLSYGIDVFGGVRRYYEGQLAQTDLQRYAVAATYQTLAANVVTAAIQEASLRAQIEATRAIIDSQQRQLGVIERQFQLGAVSNSDVLSARSELASTRATLPPQEQQLDQIRNQLAVYEGKLPGERQDTDFSLDELHLPQSVPVSLPSELVRQRPDVQQAEAQLHAASAQIGVAIANRLPKITLSASYGSTATSTGALFDDMIWNVGAGITQPLFHAGELAAKQRAAQAAYDAAAAQYRKAVLLAFQNVADSLRVLDKDAAVLQAQYEATSAAKESLRIADLQFKLGATNYLNLLTAQRQVQQTQIAYLQALAARQADTAALFQALGGGALNPPEATTAATQPSVRAD